VGICKTNESCWKYPEIARNSQNLIEESRLRQ
jgi:hypothetical protein